LQKYGGRLTLAALHSTLSYILAAGLGVLIAYFMSRAPELRALRLSQFIFIPCAMVALVYFLPDSGGAPGLGDIGAFMGFLVVLGFLVILLSPNIAHLCGAGLFRFLDPQDWTCAEEEIALRPIRKLIDKDHFHQALSDLEKILKTHRPTYEALLLKAKLLHQCGRIDDTAAALLSLIALCQTIPQQLTVMELLASLDEYRREPPAPPAPGIRRVKIHHELVLFQMSAEPPAPHKEIPPGAYDVEEVLHHDRRWLKLAGEDWGNAGMCWEAILDPRQTAAAPQKFGFVRRIARAHEAISHAVKGKPFMRQQAEAQRLFKEASQWIRQDDWPRALPLLQQASACDPDRYEIAYRLVQAARRTGGNDAAARIAAQVLEQSQWTESEEQMIRELMRPAD
jgi:tetratricopeptide (TPR) repeat protein